MENLKRVHLIGNGFDINLGIKSEIKDFLKFDNNLENIKSIINKDINEDWSIRIDTTNLHGNTESS